jgi:type III secretion system FlhB-like substrate exporter
MERITGVALRYDEELPAPFVAAKGRGELATKLIALAREHGVPVVSREELAESLFYLEVGELVPESFYRVVAELLAFVWRTQGHGAGDIKSRK